MNARSLRGVFAAFLIFAMVACGDGDGDAPVRDDAEGESPSAEVLLEELGTGSGGGNPALRLVFEADLSKRSEIARTAEVRWTGATFNVQRARAARLDGEGGCEVSRAEWFEVNAAIPFNRSTLMRLVGSGVCGVEIAPSAQDALLVVEGTYEASADPERPFSLSYMMSGGLIFDIEGLAQLGEEGTAVLFSEPDRLLEGIDLSTVDFSGDGPVRFVDSSEASAPSPALESLRDASTIFADMDGDASISVGERLEENVVGGLRIGR